jgi:hypothetical protein
MPGLDSYGLSPPGSFGAEDLERLRRSIALLAPQQPSGLDREGAMALLEELQRLEEKDGRVRRLLEQLTALVDALRDAAEAEPR